MWDVRNLLKKFNPSKCFGLDRRCVYKCLNVISFGVCITPAFVLYIMCVCVIFPFYMKEQIVLMYPFN